MADHDQGKYIYDTKEVLTVYALTIVNVAVTLFLMKKNYTDGWNDFKETFIDFQPKERESRLTTWTLFFLTKNS